VRTTGDIVALSPPLIVEKSHLERIVDVLGKAIRKNA
jgi:beta-alanine--pyruvate transaminase